MMRRIIHRGAKPFKLVSLFMLLFWMVSLTQAADPGTAALTVVDTPDETTDSSDGVSVEVEPNRRQTYTRFVPTHEWKTVEEGQAIPPGLHVRLNLETGKKEAKFLEEKKEAKFLEVEEEGLSYLKQAEKEEEDMVNKNQKTFTHDELKDALKMFKHHMTVDEEEGEEGEGEPSTSPHTGIGDKKFKSYDELKDDFEKLNAAIQTEGEVVTDLFNKLKQNSDKAELRHILAELEYSLHKIDNALLFMDLGGMSELVRLLNSTDPDLRQDTSFVLGSAMQSNPKVQITAMEAGVLQKLIKIVSTDMSMAVRKKGLYALSTLMRHFPYAQKRFLALGGLTVFSQLFTQPHTEKMRIQIITLLTDLNTEKMHSWANLQDGNPLQKEKLRQYNEFDILSNMVQTGWCDRVKSLLELQDFDTQEKVLTTMSQIAGACRSNFKSISPRIKQLERKYNRLCEEDKEKGDSENDASDFFCTLSESASSILFKLENVRDEL